MSNTSLQAFVEYIAVQGFQTELKWFVQFELCVLPVSKRLR